ncbi:hypothetical protein B7463_g2351, partial [Scytalidium lignicola]
MYPTTISVLGLAIASLALAQTSVVTLYVPGADVQPLDASIVGSDATATTYAIQCAPGTDSNDCGLPGVITLVEGPKTAKYTMSAEMDASGAVAFTGYVDCSLAGTTSAVCIESYGGNEANSPGRSTMTYTGTDLEYMPVTITAGAAAKATTGASPSSAVPSTTDTVSLATPANTSGASSSGSAASSSGSAAAQPTTGGASLSGANIKLALGGAAAVLAML